MERAIHRALRSLAAAALAATVVRAAAVAREPQIHRLVRVYDWASGYPWSFVGGIEQDRRGFLWVTATSGLYRFDGTRARRVAEPLGTAPGGTAAGRVVVCAATGRAFEATAEGLAPLDDEPESTGTRSLQTAVSTDGTPWRVRDGVVARLGPDRRWATVDLPPSADGPARSVHPGRDGRVYVSSASRVWSVERDGSIRAVAAVDRVVKVLERADGTVVMAANQWPGPVTTRIFEVTGGTPRLVYEERGARFLSIAERGEVLWVSTDRGLQALGSGYRPAYRLAPPVIPAMGNLIVDHEGSLWMATSQGLVQIPEPDVYAVLPAGGGVTRNIARTTLGVWGTFWGKLGFFADGPTGIRLLEWGEPHYAGLCRDGAGRVWTSGEEGRMQALRPDGTAGPLLDERWDPHGCGRGAGRRRWIVSRGADLWTVGDGDDRPHRIPIQLGGDEGLSFAAEAPDGTLWIASGARMCAAPAQDVLLGKPVAWRCEEVPGAHEISDIEPMPSGDVWALTMFPGTVRRRAGGRWEVVPGSERLTVNWLNSITPSAAGGAWIAGMGVLVRVAERPDTPEGWEVLEQPTAWNGLLTINVVAVEEDADGTLWLGTDVGVQRIPAGIRRRRADPPVVELVEGSANGVPLARGAAVELPHRNRLDVHFAALTYRDPGAVRYRMRLRDDDPWSPPSTDGHFTFVDLARGRYRLQVAASLDGSRWSEPPALLALHVKTPWYAEPWLVAITLLGVIGAGHLGFRLRVHRRLAREKQRTRIAMDLHDEVGSGLGTIAVLAGIAGRPDLPEERRGDVAARIVAVSQELGRSLGDIVWSLRTSSGSLDALWNQLLERARPLFASGTPRVTFEAPDPVPDDALSLVVRRNLHLVVYEALHNAARHAGASLVVLRLARDGPAWRVEVEDDGRGLSAAVAGPSVRRGLGIEAMKARVAEMGAAISWERGPAGGTLVTVRFRTGDE